MSTAALAPTADTATVWLVALHLGALHPVEQALTVGLAFGPFLVLGLVVALRRRSDRAAEEAAGQEVADDGARAAQAPDAGDGPRGAPGRDPGRD
ncbi:MAG: hypothetical protein JHD04_04590 [Nocardioides sp.]|nr:hypothetical protein [Nocardioides sp.]